MQEEEVSLGAIIAELQSTEAGRVQIELASLRATVASLRAQLAEREQTDGEEA